MHSALAALLLAAAQATLPPAGVELAPLPIEQQTALRCSIAIAMAAEQQRTGQAANTGWPDLTERGREFFVRSMAKLMDEAKLTRTALTNHARAEVAALSQPGRLADVMPACLLLLDASGA